MSSKAYVEIELLFKYLFRIHNLYSIAKFYNFLYLFYLFSSHHNNSHQYINFRNKIHFKKIYPPFMGRRQFSQDPLKVF